MTYDFTSLKPLANHVSFNNKMWWRNDWTWIAVIRILFLERAKTFILVADWGKELWSSLIEDHRKLRNYKERWAYWNSSSYRSVCANTTAWNLVGAIIILPFYNPRRNELQLAINLHAWGLWWSWGLMTDVIVSTYTRMLANTNE